MSTQPKKKEETVKKTVKETVKETTTEEEKADNHYNDDSLQKQNPGRQQDMGWESGKGGKRTRKRKRRRRKMKGGHHLYKRLGVSKYATKKTIKNAYNKLKKRNKLTSKVKRAYKILSKNKTRKQYNNKYKKHKKLKGGRERGHKNL